jgi:hypothetical protein
LLKGDLRRAALRTGPAHFLFTPRANSLHARTAMVLGWLRKSGRLALADMATHLALSVRGLRSLIAIVGPVYTISVPEPTAQDNGPKVPILASLWVRQRHPRHPSTHEDPPPRRPRPPDPCPDPPP